MSNDLLHEIERLNKAVEDLQNRNEVLDGAWTTANNHRNALVEERRELSAEVGELKKKIALAEKSWNAAMEERNQWEDDWKQMRDACAEQDDEIGVLKAENERMRAAMEDEQKWVFHFREQPEDNDDVLEQYRTNCRRVQKIISTALGEKP